MDISLYMDNYTIEQEIGRGTYGKVYRGYDKRFKYPVAIKQIKMNKDHGVPCVTLREISILKQLKHKNIVRLYDVIHSESDMYLIFEYLDSDLGRFIRQHKHLSANTSIYLMRRMMEGLRFCHENMIMHRDLKPQNIFLSNNGEVRIGDMGMARAYVGPNAIYSYEVITQQYRPIELFLGDTSYDFSVDIWSMGCILYEMLTGKYLFATRVPADQIVSIFKMFGTPTDWPKISILPNFDIKIHTFAPPAKPNIPSIEEEEDMGASKDIVYLRQLLGWMLKVNPQKRCTAEECLQSLSMRTVPFVG